ncbi:flagellar hook-associated protein FlgK [Zymomonas mobilis]|uniref:Flagellar hook-associated protein 1 n=1 Tax=Zymomonas mobilis subsp. pomaceae (strain ATCC 29192 / DSM 22645 / JCM 10191 / CCUG 17912 / NBRC 13757 / NCIMB 11200 / NRRL B-4491 / Barker I) TaxID=579138 RepID=F8ERR0_ZYMMT|nr:flagellar hook-associated protein FlgK [Zymomonas mobilis]AEI37518.1 flagellar hook-associated protein FlgK [Zymomonas mobilis subsp. pomaceae ATCC 29192]MDX5948886.1 flagellar hook-associated protein FlgK [Zymomonas mobilis subsp. pomaceae]GEB88693.1 flagellar hook-associated protein 1 [Zymomonas mobilis subsp. pomaceae]
MSDILQIGASGVLNYGKAMDVISENVSNAQTTGYARRDVKLTEAPNGGSGILGLNQVSGNGVSTQSVTRAWDGFAATHVRNTASDAGEASAVSRWMSSAETAINSGTSGTDSQITSFFTSITALASNPSNTTQQSAAITSLSDATKAISDSATSLKGVSTGISDEADGTVSVINSDLSTLAKVNTAMLQTPAGTDASAGLADQRDQLLDDLSSKIGINADIASNGTVKITLSGSGNGQTLLSSTAAGQFAGSFSSSMDSSGNLTIGVKDALNSSNNRNMTNTAGGSLTGLMTVASNVADERSDLNTIASDFVTQVNSWNGNGTTTSGATGGDLLSITDGDATTITTTTSDGSAIAGANSSSANGNLQNISNLRGSNGVEANYATLVSNNAQLTSTASTNATNTENLYTTASKTRDSLSGVDLDTEAAQLLRYQQAYQASAKVLQVAQSTMQSIFELF